MKRALRSAQVLAAAVCVVSIMSTARAAVLIDDFGEPNQYISINAVAGTGSGGSVTVMSPYPLNDDDPVTRDTSANVGTNIKSGTYPGTVNLVDYVNGPSGYTQTVDSFYASAFRGDLTTMNSVGQIVSSSPDADPVLGLTDFSQRDVQLTVTSAGGIATYTAGNFTMSGGGGPSATLLMQYDGVDSSSEVSTFVNARHLDDGIGLSGYDITVGDGNAFYFNNITGNGDILVNISVWTYGSASPQTGTGVISLVQDAAPINFAILYSSFSGAGAGFDRVEGIDISFTLAGDYDIHFLDGPSPTGFFATNPEPATLAMWSLFGVGGLGLGWLRRRKCVAT